ncbi:MAG: hypothetical protein K8S56_03580 [Candidatus Cloacimonetes bacterium]|nr:hypothetical protein [Candidatus Cloacimonadota bacterium]
MFLMAILLLSLLTAQDTPIETRVDSLLVPADSTLIDSVFAETDSTKVDSLFYAADSIYYFVLKDLMQLSDNASMRYGSANLKADSISIDLENDTASSHGQAWLEDGSYLIIGDDIYFSFDTHEGLVTNGATRFDKGFYYGKEVRKVGKNTYDIDKGYFTTCESAQPDFYIYSQRMRLYKNDKIVARPIVFLVNHFPIFFLPYGTISIKRGRHSGLLIPTPGWNKVDGKFIRNLAYFQIFSEYADATASFDYMERTGWESRFETLYKKRYEFDGRLYARLQKRTVSIKSTEYEWLLQQRHHHNIGYKQTFDMNLEFRTKKIWETDVDEDKRLNESISSGMVWKRPLFSRSLHVSGDYNQDLLNDTRDITLPSVSFSLLSKPVYELFVSEEDAEADNENWYKDLSFSYSFKAAHNGSINDPDPTAAEIFWKTKKDSTGYYIIQHNAGIKHVMRLTYSYKVFGWLNLVQSISGNEVWFDRDKNNNKWVRAADYRTSSSSSFTMYGLRKFDNFYLSAVRHLFTPGVSFSYHPDFSENADYYSFSGISVNSGKKIRSLRFSLENKWQIKIAGKDDKADKKINDFFTTSSGFSFNYEDKGKRFSTISHSLSFRPAKYTNPWFGLNYSNSASMTQDAYNFDITNWRLSTRFGVNGDAVYTDYFPLPPNRFETNKFYIEDEEEDVESPIATIEQLEEMESDTESWSLTSTHAITKDELTNDTTSNLRNSATLQVTKNWKVTYSNYLDLEEGEIRSHTLSILRNLQCWDIRFSWNKSNDFWDYRFTIENIKLPQSLKYTTSDHKH